MLNCRGFLVAGLRFPCYSIEQQKTGAGGTAVLKQALEERRMNENGKSPKRDRSLYQILFTPEGFEPDFPADEEGEEEAKGYREAPWEAVYALGFTPADAAEGSTFHWLHTLGQRFVRGLTRQPALEITREQTTVPLEAEESGRLMDALPFGIGTEYVTIEWLSRAWERLTEIFRREIRAYDQTVEMYFTEKLQDLRIPERIFFHLVESKAEDYPFAFLATYSTRDGADQVRHQPLSYALIEYKKDREKLLGLLSCLNRAADACPLIAEFVASGELFHPLKLSAKEAYEILQKVPAIEEAGISCRLPDWWRRKAASVSITVSIGEKGKSTLNMDSLLTMTPALTVDGEKLTKAEIRKLLAQSEGLALVKGKWVEVNHEKLQALLKEMEKYGGDLTMIEALRLQGGLGLKEKDKDVEITSGAYYAQLLDRMRHPQQIATPEVPAEVHALLRPYQKTGYAWLNQMAGLGFGACLADDMGLGKTLQVITYLAELRRERPEARALLVAPASLIGNWEKEVRRFAPEMTMQVLHGAASARLAETLLESDACLTVTTYGMASRMTELRERTWDCLILDEAQAIKNPGTQQSKAVKKIPARYRIAMTGTPIENNLSNLWSLFDFLNRGLLGTAKEFDSYAKALREKGSYAGLKRMVSPFILRRLKTDKNIIADLPEKMEMTDYVELTRKQIALYNKEVLDLSDRLEAGTASDIGRKGLVLQSISRFKQICNHPDQYLGQDGYAVSESGKMQALTEICETIRDKHERALIFTQYKEITPHLDEMLRTVFGRRGLVISGDVKVKERTRLVDQFNGEAYVPYMILTIKAGGTGLNLTRANHVVLFDRWWNPAVESQAIDRAFRIGQTKDVMVHKFITRATIEEKIAEMIASKEQMAREIVGESGEAWLTEMSNQELLNLVKLEV